MDKTSNSSIYRGIAMWSSAIVGHIKEAFWLNYLAHP
jgi:hypothetical protein